MNGSNMRDKARAIFGKTFFENTKEPAPAKNAAVALQKRANGRPIPTYKVGGIVKKKDGGVKLLPTGEITDAVRDLYKQALRDDEAGRRDAYAKGNKWLPDVERGTTRGPDITVQAPARENVKKPTSPASGATPPGMSSKPVKKKAVGGIVKKQAGGALTAAEKARAEAMIRQRGDAAMRDPLVMRFLDTQNRGRMSVPGVGPKAAQRRAEGGGIEAQRLEARAAAGRYKDGGNVQKKAAGGKAEDRGPTTVGQRDAAYHRMKGAAALPEQKTNLSLRDRQTEVEALARKISNATGKTGVVTQSSQAPVARGSAKEMAQGDYGVPVRAIARPGGNKNGGKIAKKASGGMTARSDRDVIVAKARGPKNEIIVQPVKRAVGGNVQKKGDVSKPMGAMGHRMQSGISFDKQAVGTPNSKLADRGLEGFHSMMKKKMVDNFVGDPVAAPRPRKKGGEIMKPVKRAVGGAGKTRKGMC
jgi:hypothetical protein